ncbi:MAG: type II secretion system protein [Candidatus Shapirobacteria bacterium]|nr:type II secretion system protein [Candidatus Shapirobacteria bacterium]MDD4410385.1 type II secretion system protein [Candidatus Shapirobacteria bacterium]
MKKNKKNKGFTLFELLVSISIIGILTALASVAFSGAQKKARDARRLEDVKNIQTAAEQYYSQSPTYSYPATYVAGNTWTPVAGGTAVLESYPNDPKGAAYGSYACASGATCNTTGYCICALMENSANANATGACNFSVGVKTHFCVKNQQ